MDLRYQRVATLVGEDFEKIARLRVLILGVGGVGGYALDCLYRSGVKDITIVDFDSFEVSNQNRQIGSENLGAIKVEALAGVYSGITPIEAKIDRDWVREFDFEPFDVVIDAIDDIDAKVAIAKRCYKKLICSMGSAKKLDPTKIEIAHVWNVKGDRFARKFKEMLKKEGFNRDFLAVFSSEAPKCKELGSFVGVTGAFGLTICSQVIKKVVESKN